MRARFWCLFIGVVLLASGVARADYTGVPIDAAFSYFGDTNFQNGNTFDRLGSGSFILDQRYGTGQIAFLWTAVFTNNTLTVTDEFYFGTGFEWAFFAYGPPPPAFSQITLLSSNFSPTLTYRLDDGIILMDWMGTDVQGDQTMTATFTYAPAVKPVPEPSSLILLGTACLFGLDIMRRKHLVQADGHQ